MTDTPPERYPGDVVFVRAEDEESIESALDMLNESLPANRGRHVAPNVEYGERGDAADLPTRRRAR